MQNPASQPLETVDLTDEHRKAVLREFAEIMEMTGSPLQALDAYAVGYVDIDGILWSDARGTSFENIQRNVYRTRNMLEKLNLGEI